MEEQKNNIRVLLSDPAEIVLDDILKSFGLEEKNVVVDRLVKDFAKEILSEKDFISALQKEMAITSEVSEKLTKEIITKLVPILIKAPEEKFNDPDFREEISKKVFGGEKNSLDISEKKDMDIFPKVEPAKNATETAQKTKAMPKIPTPITKAKGKSRLPQKNIVVEKIKKPTVVQATPRTGPDNYREPIE
jgi:hypothetical protein